jgi:hypothetical protein
MQWPLMQFCPVAHVVVQSPQWSLLIFRLKHMPEHISSPPGHAHMLLLQVWPLGHALVQLPQCAGLFVVFTHWGGIPQAWVFCGQTHMPAWQT